MKVQRRMKKTYMGITLGELRRKGLQAVPSKLLWRLQAVSHQRNSSQTVSRNVLRTLGPQRWTWRRLQTINSKSQALRATLQLRGDSDDNPVVSPAERVNKRKLTLNSQICPPINFEVHDPRKLTYQHKLDIYQAVKEN